MKKRTLISILLTLICIIATNKYWLIFKPMQVGFKAVGSGYTRFEVMLNKKDNNEFKKVKSAITKIDLDKKNKVSVKIKRIKLPKRLKIAIDKEFEGNSPIYLSSFELKDGKIKLDDLKSFTAQGARIKVNNDSLVLYPEKESFSLIYNKPLDARASIKFDVKVFLIITILSALLAYKLTSYVADFSTIKQQSRIDIIFVVVFFIMLFVPMSKISDAEKSIGENRKLAKYKPLLAHGEVNYDFGKNFNDWFSDRFNLRYLLVEAYMDFNYSIAKNYYGGRDNKAWINKANNWLFRPPENIITPLTSDEYKNYKNNIEKLILFCNKNHIKLYILVFPLKDDIYREFDLTSLEQRPDRTIQFVKDIKKDLGFGIIYPRDEFMSAKEHNYLYYKTDHHATDSGAFIGYQMLMNQIKQEFPDIKITNEADYDISYNNLVRAGEKRAVQDYTKGATYGYLSLQDEKILNTQYKYYDYKKNKDVKIIDEKDKKREFLNKDEKYKAILIGNSFAESLSFFLTTSFKDLKKYRTNDGKTPDDEELSMERFERDIEEFKPDVLIICIHSGYIKHFKYLYGEEN